MDSNVQIANHILEEYWEINEIVVSGSSAFSKTSLNIRKFMVHILLKPEETSKHRHAMQRTLKSKIMKHYLLKWTEIELKAEN